jgi:hypothetical protein
MWKRLIFLWLYAVTAAPAITYDHESRRPAGTGSQAGQFRCYLADDLQTVRGILVLTPGSNMDGRTAVDEAVWQSLAAKHRLALVACFFSESLTGVDYDIAFKGSGQLLLDAIDAFADQSRHPEMKNLPLVLWGFSAGGEFNYSFTSWKPDRVIAFVVNKVEDFQSYSGEWTPPMLKVPGIYFFGGKDVDRRIRAVTEGFQRGRARGALLCLLPDKNAGHAIGNSIQMAIPFLDAVIGQRLTDSGVLKDISPQSGWLGNLSTGEVSPASTYAGKKETASWLPDKASAFKWKELLAQ